MLDLTNERKRALANPDAKSAGSFGQPMRTGELNNFEDGDIVTIPEVKIVNGKLVDASGQEVVITEPLRRNGNIQTDMQGNPRMLTYMLVPVKRKNGTEATARLFPSIFWKRRLELAAGDSETGAQYVTTTGTVIDDIISCPSVDEAIVMIANHGTGAKKGQFVVNLRKIRTFEFNNDPSIKKPTDDRIPTLNWA